MANDSMQLGDSNAKPLEVAIIGMSARLPGVRTLVEFHDLLRTGRSVTGDVPGERRRHSCLSADARYPAGGYLERVDLFDHEFFGLSRREAELMDPQQRFLLEMACGAVEDAGYAVTDIRGSSTAVFVGCRYPDYYLLLPSHVSGMAMVGNIPAMAAGRISYHLDLRGPAVTVDTSCSTALYAIHAGCRALAAGDATMCLIGAVNLVNLFADQGRANANLGVTAADGKCRPFDWRASGTVGGEGGAVLLLKPLSAARADGDWVYAVIQGSAANHGGARSGGLTVPSHDAEAQVIARAWRNSGLQLGALTYVEAHGTATKIGDPIEFKGLCQAFRELLAPDQCVRIGSVKGNIGHLDAAAGMAGVVKTTLSLNHGELFPAPNFERPNPSMELDEGLDIAVQAHLAEWQAEPHPRRAGVSAFSLSGTNVHVVLEQGWRAPLEPHEERPFLLKLSADSQEALRRYASEVRDYVACSAHPPDDVAYTLNTARDDHRLRCAIVANSFSDAAQQLGAIADGALLPEAAGRRRLVLLLSDGPSPAAMKRFWSELPWYVTRAEATEQAARRGESHLALWHQYLLAQFLSDSGIALHGIVGTALGNLAKRVILNETTISEAFEAVAHIPTSPVDPARLKDVIRELDVAPTLYVAGSETDRLVRQLPTISTFRERVIFYDELRALELIAALYRGGVDVGWKHFHTASSSGRTPRRVPAPTHAFNATRCWFTDTPEGALLVPPAASVVSESASDTEYAPDAAWMPTQKRVGALWYEVLKPERLDLDDVFFEVGGHSLNGLDLADRIARDFGVTFDIQDLYSKPTIRLIADAVDAASAPAQQSIVPTLAETAAFELSHVQHRVWIAAALDPSGATYNVPQACSFSGTLDIPKLEAALGKLCARHDSLRTAFRSSATGAMQEVVPHIEATLEVVDLRSAEVPDEVARHGIDSFARQPFALERPPLFRMALFRLADDRSVLALIIHHLICDGWSIGVLLRDLVTLYLAEIGAAPLALREQQPQYRDYAHWHKGLLASAKAAEHAAYWARTLEKAPPTKSPLRRASVDPAQGGTERLEFDFDPLADRLHAFAASHQVTLFTAVFAGIFMTLHGLSGATDICAATDLAGRSRSEFRETVGLFVNTLPIRVRVEQDLTFASLLERVAIALRGAMQHQDYPLDRILNDHARASHASRDSWGPFDVQVSFQNPADFSVEQRTLERAKLDIDAFEVHPPGHRFNMEISIVHLKQRLRGMAFFDSQVFRRTTVELLTLRLIEWLAAALDEPSATIGEICGRCVRPEPAKLFAEELF